MNGQHCHPNGNQPIDLQWLRIFPLDGFDESETLRVKKLAKQTFSFSKSFSKITAPRCDIPNICIDSKAKEMYCVFMHVSSQLSKVIQGFINRVIKAFLFLEMR